MKLVWMAVVDRADTRVDKDLETMDAGGVRDVDVGFTDRGAVARGLRDGVEWSRGSSQDLHPA